jgi:hypothetical protein
MVNATVDVIAPKCFVLPTLTGESLNLTGCISGMCFISGADAYVTFGPSMHKKLT